MTAQEAQAFADAWVAAWNAHDLDAILAHYREDVVFTSPFAVEVAGRADGTLRGKDELGAYFAAALARFPDLRFSPPRVAAGVGSVCLVYRSVRDLEAAETMVLDAEGRVARVLAHYRAADAA